MSCGEQVLLKYFHINPYTLQKITLFFMLFFCLFGIGRSDNLFTLPQEILSMAESQYGESARLRLLAWQTLIRESTGLAEETKLERVNTFFNQLQFIDDIVHWKKSDYWATPIEFLSTGGGDCEDFSLAKYFTLKALGIAEKKFHMTYVRALNPNQAHMVVTYYATPRAIPLILDNLIAEIKPATQRKDLIPVYSFNGSGLWLAKSRGQGQKVGDSVRLERWQSLLKRMPEKLK
jgi:predicted transglutaminase-like cysteine proteinase